MRRNWSTARSRRTGRTTSKLSCARRWPCVTSSARRSRLPRNSKRSTPSAKTNGATMKRFRWTRRAALLGMALTASCVLAAPGAQAQAVHALVTTPVGSDGVGALAMQFGRWHRAGWVAKMKLLQVLPRQRESPGFSGLALVTLRSPSAYRAWRAEAERLLGAGAEVGEVKVVRNEGRSGD